MSITESENNLTEVVLSTWTTPDQARIENFLATTAMQRLNLLDEVDL